MHRRRQRPRHPHPRSTPKRAFRRWEVVFTKVNAGGKFGGDSGYKVSSGLHGVGVKAVNALSEWLEAEVYQHGNIYRQVYNRGVPQRALAVVGKTEKTGTKVTFLPDAEISRRRSSSTSICACGSKSSPF